MLPWKLLVLAYTLAGILPVLWLDQSKVPRRGAFIAIIYLVWFLGALGFAAYWASRPV